MNKKCIKDIDIKNKRLLIRVSMIQRPKTYLQTLILKIRIGRIGGGFMDWGR